MDKAANNVTFTNLHPRAGDVRAEVYAGLTAKQKTVDPKYFYDERGSHLFDAITALPEYYPTRTETGILADNSADIAACCRSDSILIEPGSGSSQKVRLLLPDLRPSAYVPIDISAEFLEEAAFQLGSEFPWLEVRAVCADMTQSEFLLKDIPPNRRVVFYPGSTIGNLDPAAAITFLVRMHDWIGGDGGMLIGVDLHKSTLRLEAAYNDAEGVTAAFNLNVLDRINTLIDAEFDPGTFNHQAFYNEEQQRIEMHLISQVAQEVPCNGSLLTFKKGETIHTENSYKYTVDGFAELASKAGLEIRQTWLDAEELFSVHFLVPQRISQSEESGSEA